MHRSLLIPALAGLALIGACATATPYQPVTTASERGYANQQIESDRWMISFAGNSLTDRQTVETYLLYRAAELTSQQGFDHFRVVRRDTDADTSFVPVGGSAYYGHFHPSYRFYGRHGRAFAYPAFHYRGFADPFWGAPDYREITRYEATAEIMMGRGPKPSDPAYFSAREVLQNLSQRVVRPAA